MFPHKEKGIIFLKIKGQCNIRSILPKRTKHFLNCLAVHMMLTNVIMIKQIKNVFQIKTKPVDRRI